MAPILPLAGSCHCGQVRFEVTTNLDSVISCNCSHCARKGFLLTFVPRDQFTLLRGQDKLAEYRFNKHAILHQFCKVCGVQAFAYGAMPDGSPVAAVNVRCLDNVDIDALQIQQVDGRSF